MMTAEQIYEAGADSNGEAARGRLRSTRSAPDEVPPTRRVADGPITASTEEELTNTKRGFCGTPGCGLDDYHEGPCCDVGGCKGNMCKCIFVDGKQRTRRRSQNAWFEAEHRPKAVCELVATEATPAPGEDGGGWRPSTGSRTREVIRQNGAGGGHAEGEGESKEESGESEGESGEESESESESEELCGFLGCTKPEGHAGEHEVPVLGKRRRQPVPADESTLNGIVLMGPQQSGIREIRPPVGIPAREGLARGIFQPLGSARSDPLLGSQLGRV